MSGLLVLDASAVLELLLNTPRAKAVANAVASAQSLHAPHLLDLEVLQVLRRAHRIGKLDEARAQAVLDDLAHLPIARYEHASFARRIWALRHSHSAYEAAYVTLAEVLGAPLLTCDVRLANSHGHGARIEVVGVRTA